MKRIRTAAGYAGPVPSINNQILCLSRVLLGINREKNLVDIYLKIYISMCIYIWGTMGRQLIVRIQRPVCSY